MYLVLDTNILHQESLLSSDMKILLRVVNSGLVTVCLPALVRREYTTKIAQDAGSKFQSAIASLDQVAKFARICRVEADVLAAARAVSELKAQFMASYEEDFTEWMRAFGVREIPMDAGHLDGVMNDYFAGNPPFRSPKARDDIPDALIGAAIGSLIAEVGPVAIATKDVGFQSYLKKVEGAAVFEGIQEFLKVDDVQRELTRLDHEENVDEYLALLADAKYLAGLAEAVAASQSILDEIYLEDEEVVGRERLDMDCFGVRVNAPIVDNIKSLELSDPSYVGSSEYAFALEIQAAIAVDFCASYGEYLELSDAREAAVRIESMSGDGICDLQEDRQVLILGRLIVDIAGVKLAELKERLAQGTNFADGFRMSIEASKAEIRRGDGT